GSHRHERSSMITVLDSSAGGLQQVLERYWGYTTFRPLQREAMDAIVNRRDSLVVMPTGAGKSLCFQAPALLGSGLAVVVSPLISLMKDQVDTLVGNGVAAACYNSAQASDHKASVAAGLREGRYRLLYVSPERLRGPRRRPLPCAGVVGRRRLRGDRRGALHQPVGPRLPSRVPPARTPAHDLAAAQ